MAIAGFYLQDDFQGRSLFGAPDARFAGLVLHPQVDKKGYGTGSHWLNTALTLNPHLIGAHIPVGIAV